MSLRAKQSNLDQVLGPASPIPWSESDQWELAGEPSAILRRAAVAPTQKMAQHRADERCDEPVAALVAGDHRCCFFVVQETMRRRKASGTDDHLGVGNGLDVAQPACAPTKGTHHDRLRPIFAILQNLQDRVTAQAGAAPGMVQEQETMSEQPTAFPPVQIDGNSKEALQHTLRSGRADG